MVTALASVLVSVKIQVADTFEAISPRRAGQASADVVGLVPEDGKSYPSEREHNGQ
jgi:hypothetical protein